MSHVAFVDFFCDPSDLLIPNATEGDLYWTTLDQPECTNGTYNCLESVYTTNLGKSPPDGPGSWLKFSTSRDPETVQVAPGFTHIFELTFVDGGAYKVTIGEIPSPVCAAFRGGKSLPTPLQRAAPEAGVSPGTVSAGSPPTPR